MSTNKTCKVCGEKYFYCFNHTCIDNQPSYMALFHDENCKLIFEALNKLYFEQISEKDAIKVLRSCDLSVLDNVDADAKIKSQVTALLEKKPAKRTKVVKTDECFASDELFSDNANGTPEKEFHPTIDKQQ